MKEASAIEQLMYRWADFQRGASPLGYGSSPLEAQHKFLTAGGERDSGVRTAQGVATKSMRADAEEWPAEVAMIEDGMAALFRSRPKAYYAVRSFYLHEYPHRRLKRDEGRLVPVRMCRLTRNIGEKTLAYQERLAQRMLVSWRNWRHQFDLGMAFMGAWAESRGAG